MEPVTLSDCPPDRQQIWIERQQSMEQREVRMQICKAIFWISLFLIEALSERRV
jgi:hypothetical protein